MREVHKKQPPGPKTTKSVGAVIIEKTKRKVLIVNQIKGDYWVFPKGRGQRGETEEQTLRREIFEEVGITDFTILPYFRESMRYIFVTTKKTKIRREIVYYIIQVKSHGFQVGKDEIKEGKWCSFNEAMQYLKYPGQHELLAKVKSYLHV